jgi:hypothetical protein
MAVRLSTRKIPGTHFCYRLSRSQGHSAAGRIRSVEKRNDLPACGVVPQATTLKRARDGHVCQRVIISVNLYFTAFVSWGYVFLGFVALALSNCCISRQLVAPLEPLSNIRRVKCQSSLLRHFLHSAIISKPLAVPQLNCVCEDNWKSATGQTLFFIGSVLGPLGLGVMADHIGRLPVLVLSNILALLGNVATSFTYQLPEFAASRPCCGRELHHDA